MLNAKYVEINSYTNEITIKVAEQKKEQTNITIEANEKENRTEQTKENLKQLMNIYICVS
jgi:predicted nuclease with TOPRIM domain